MEKRQVEPSSTQTALLGSQVEFKGATFTAVTLLPYTRRDGTATLLVIWRGPCAMCGELFDQTGTRAPWGHLARTCKRHRGQLPNAWQKARQSADKKRGADVAA